MCPVTYTSPYSASTPQSRSRFPGSISHRGRRSRSSQRSIMARAVLTGMGFTSQNRASQSRRSYSWSLPAVTKSPSRQAWVRARISLGTTLAATEMTPTPPRSMMGAVSSSLPDHM